jgi:hypothetical protein
MDTQDALKRLCALITVVGEDVFKSKVPHDCFCGENPAALAHGGAKVDWQVINFIEEAVREKIDGMSAKLEDFLNKSIKSGYCPQCGSDQKGEKIPQEYIDRGLYREGLTHYSRTIGVEYGYNHPARYDGVSEWNCPDCGYREGRWSGKALADGEYEPRWGGK